MIGRNTLRQRVEALVDRAIRGRRSSQRQIIRSYASEVAGSLELEHLLNVLLKYLPAAAASAKVQVYLLDLRTGEYRRAAALGFTDSASPLHKGHPLVESLDAENVPCLVSSAEPDLEVERSSCPAESFLRGEGLVLCVPLRSRGRLIGWFAFGPPYAEDDYSVQDRRFLREFADQSAVPIQNALLYHDSERRARQLAVLNRIGHILSSTLDLRELLDRLVAELVEVFSAETASLLLVDRNTEELVFEVAQGASSMPVLGRRLPPGVQSIARHVAETGKPRKPRTLKGPRKAGADDLKQLKGVGPKLEKTLNELGFYHFDQIAKWTGEEVAWVDDNLKFKGRIERDGWIEQAKILAEGGQTEFSKKVKKGDVY